MTKTVVMVVVIFKKGLCVVLSLLRVVMQSLGNSDDDM